jgi:hypothetical protein
MLHINDTNAAHEKDTLEEIKLILDSFTSEGRGGATITSEVGTEETFASVHATGESSVRCKGVRPSKSKFVAFVCVEGKNPMFMGEYALQSNAALAHDIGANELNVTGRLHGRALNFKTEEEYNNARNKELSLDVSGSIADIEKKISQGISEIRNPSKKQKESVFRGTKLIKTTNGETKYHATLYHNKKQLALGCYELECDAAWCYNEAACLWKGTSWMFNFESKNQYLKMRDLEVIWKGIDSIVVESNDDVNQLIKIGLESLMIEPIPECTHADIQYESSPAQDNPAAKDDSDDLSFIVTKEPKSSKFIGVTYLKGKNKYRTSIHVSNKQYFIGRQYKLESDAASCYDQTLRVLCLADERKSNFISFDQYKAAQEAEEKIIGENVDGIAKVAAQIQQQVDKIVTNVESNRNAVSDKAGNCADDDRQALAANKEKVS